MKFVETFRVICLIYQIDFEIDINLFLKSVLASENLNDKYLYFEKVVKSLLNIVLIDEDFFASCSLLSTNFQKILTENCDLVQLCSILVKQINVKLKDEMKGDKILDFLDFRPSLSPTSLSGQLQVSESLIDLSVEAKISLCDSLVNFIMLDLKSYKEFLSRYEEKVVNIRLNIVRLKKEQHELETNNGIFNAESTHDSSSEIQLQLDAKSNEILKLRKKLEKAKDNVKYLSRAQEPFGRIETTKKDSDIIEFIYFWHFKSLPNCLVVEKRILNPTAHFGIVFNCMEFCSEWHLIDNLRTLRSVFDFLNLNLTDSCLTNKILEIESNIENSFVGVDEEEIITNMEKLRKKTKTSRTNKSEIILKEMFEIEILDKETLSVKFDLKVEVFKTNNELARRKISNQNRLEFFQVNKTLNLLNF
jgi:hypothetical protein